MADKKTVEDSLKMIEGLLIAITLLRRMILFQKFNGS